MRGLQGRVLLLPALAVLAAAVAFAPPASAQVTVTVAVTGDAVPGGTVTATATVDITDGSSIQSYAWTQTGGADAVLSGIDTDAVTVALGSAAAYKDHLIHVLMEPPIGPDQLPPNVPPPEGEFYGGLQDRFQVVGIDPFSIEEAAMVTLQVEVVTTSGTYHGEGEIHTALGWSTATGIRTVPVGVPVLLHGKTQDSYDWALDGPGSAELDDAASQSPSFTPDAAGTYEVTVTDITDPATPTAVTLTVYAGNWQGVITGQDADGRPVASASCTGCHAEGSIAPDSFTPWAQSGHAHIFTTQLNTRTGYSAGCFSCHTVGYNTAAVNGGIDDASDYQAFLDSGMLGVPAADNWTNMLANFGNSAKLANIQCDNCHGPQGAMAAHGAAGPEGEPRASLSSMVCAQCHGEPPRHGRYTQWQLSGHANYELAVEEGTNGNCGRCHSANGFVAWVPALTDDNPDNDVDSVEVTWTEDEVHPQTCQACHDPHDIGTASGDATNATVRVTGDSPMLMAGYVATNMGKGAICATCHNTRRGPRLWNDSTFSEIAGTAESTRAPHPPSQTDLLMGQNLYQTQDVGARSPHADVTNSCVACHMQATPPPPDLSYQLGGTNHTFYASNTICTDCHGTGVTADQVQGPVSAALDQVKALIEDGLMTVMGEQIAGGASIAVGTGTTITSMDTVDSVEFGDSGGRQAITIHFTDGTSAGPTGLNNVNVVPATGDPFLLYSVTPTAVVKAGWNWIMVHSDGSLGVHNPDFIQTSLENTITALESSGPCVADATTMCLNDDRFKLQLSWTSPQGSGMGQVVPAGSADSGLFWFFNSDNWEMLVKVLDGCTINDRYWVFYAATTNVGFTLTVTDTEAGSVKTYTNAQGTAAPPVQDTAAFASCP